MEIVEDLEPQRRGTYAGAVGYLSFDGNLDTCIAIRTAYVDGETIHIGSGAGIVRGLRSGVGSNRETMNKAGALFAAVEGGRGTRAGRLVVILVVDNYDSFTYNLVQYLGELGASPEVVRNDQASVAQVKRMKPERIVISPGPGRPGGCRHLLLRDPRVRAQGARAGGLSRSSVPRGGLRRPDRARGAGCSTGRPPASSTTARISSGGWRIRSRPRGIIP